MLAAARACVGPQEFFGVDDGRAGLRGRRESGPVHLAARRFLFKRVERL
jgi:hypothetical protein